MSDNNLRWAFLGITIGLIFGMWIGLSTAKSDLKDKAIEHKAAYYHPETGDFTWREK